MSYKDFFGENHPMAAAPTETATPPKPSLTSDGPTPNVEKYDLLAFQGFSSGRPLLLERPTRYVDRIIDSMRQIVAVPDGDEHGGIMGRAYLSPIFTLPFALPHEGDGISGETANRYPYLHFPANHDWNPDETSLDEYLLAIEYVYVTSDIAQETDDGDLITYGVDGDYTIDDDLWRTACDWTKEISGPLSDLNKGRLLGFALNSDNEKEIETVSGLFDLWQEQRDPQRILDDAQQAAGDVKDLHDMLFDTPIDPFH